MKIISIAVQMTEAETAEWEGSEGRARVQRRVAELLRPIIWPPTQAPRYEARGNEAQRMHERRQDFSALDPVEVELVPFDGPDTVDTFELTPAGEVRRCAMPEGAPPWD